MTETTATVAITSIVFPFGSFEFFFVEFVSDFEFRYSNLIA